MRLDKLSSLGRTLDPQYRTNLAIIIVVAVVFVGRTLMQLLVGDGFVDSVIEGVLMTLTVMFAWIVARELDPDHDWAAFVAVGLSVVAVLAWGQPGWGVILGALGVTLILRIVNRTVGPPATTGDSLALLGLMGLLIWQQSWGYGFIAGLTLWVDSQEAPSYKRHLPFAGIALLMAVAAIIFRGGLGIEDFPSSSAIAAVIVGSILFLPVVGMTRRVQSVSDATQEPLRLRRVQAGQMIGWLTAVSMALLYGEAGILSLMPLWAALLGVPLYRLGKGVLAPANE